MKKAGQAKEKSDAETIAQIMTQIFEECVILLEAGHTQATSHKEDYVDLKKAKYRNKVQVEKDNVALYTNMNANKGQRNWRWFKGNCCYYGIQGHKAVACHKKKVAEKSVSGEKTQTGNDSKYCYKQV